MNKIKLNINHLKKYNAKPAYFGLGFIQLKIDKNTRLHFYHNDLPVLVDEPHDHRYDFSSYILQGTFYQNIWQFNTSVSGKYERSNVSCDPNVNAPEQTTNGTLQHVIETMHPAGTYYKIDKDTLHTVSASDNCITQLTRTTPVKDFPWVVRKKGADTVCPFSAPISTKRCWEMIREMLPENGQKKKPGYHLDKIPKGLIGEPSKIVEEALEIADAHAQNVKIMSQVEMSDLYGALDRYREKYHAELTMKDIRAMYKVTRRAFENKHR